MSRKCASTPCIFGTPTTRHDNRFGMKCLLWRHLAIWVTTPSGPFSTFLTQWLSQENCQVSALYLIPVKLGMRFKIAKSPICPAIAVLELCRHATKVQLDQSSWIFVVDSPSAVWAKPYPHTPPKKFFWWVKFWFFDFAISSYLTLKLSTNVLYLLFVWGWRYPPPPRLWTRWCVCLLSLNRFPQ